MCSRRRRPTFVACLKPNNWGTIGTIQMKLSVETHEYEGFIVLKLQGINLKRRKLTQSSYFWHIFR